MSLPDPDWANAEPDAVERGGRWLAVLRAPGDTEEILWEGSTLMGSAEDAETYAKRVKRVKEKGHPVSGTVRQLQDVKLPEPAEPSLWTGLTGSAPAAPEPALPAAAMADDGRVGDLVAGVVVTEPDGFNGTLHDKHTPYTIRWRCEHGHQDWLTAERCALDYRRRHAGAAWFTGGDANVTLHMPPATGDANVTSVWAGPLTANVSGQLKANVNSPNANVTVMPGSEVRVLAPRRARISTRVDGACLEVVITAPNSDKENDEH